MTSGNLSGEPIVTDDDAGAHRLAGLADAWLQHDRPIHVPCDDSVVRVAGGARAAGAPLARLRAAAGRAAGAGAPGARGRRRSEEHVLRRRRALRLAVGARRRHGRPRDPAGVRRARPRTWRRSPASCPRCSSPTAHPALPQRGVGRAQRRRTRRCARVQHHHAHIASAMAENGHDGASRCIGFAFDGTGYGDDGAVWGGEVLLADYDGYERAAHLRYSPLPGGDAGVRNPCRMALSHLRAAGVAWDPALPCVAACSADRAARARPAARTRSRLRADIEHGPAVRRDVLAGRRVPPRRLRGRGGDAVRGAGARRPVDDCGAAATRSTSQPATAALATRPGAGDRAPPPPTSWPACPQQLVAARFHLARGRAGRRASAIAAAPSRARHRRAVRRRVPERVAHRAVREAPRGARVPRAAPPTRAAERRRARARTDRRRRPTQH